MMTSLLVVLLLCVGVAREVEGEFLQTTPPAPSIDSSKNQTPLSINETGGELYYITYCVFNQRR